MQWWNNWQTDKQYPTTRLTLWRCDDLQKWISSHNEFNIFSSGNNTQKPLQNQQLLGTLYFVVGTRMIFLIKIFFLSKIVNNLCYLKKTVPNWKDFAIKRIYLSPDIGSIEFWPESNARHSNLGKFTNNPVRLPVEWNWWNQFFLILSPFPKGNITNFMKYIPIVMGKKLNEFFF